MLDVKAEVLDRLGRSADALELRGRVVELRFFRCTLLTDPRPALGQEMRWVRRDELTILQLPPADDELVRMLT